MRFYGKVINGWNGEIAGKALVSRKRISFLGDVDPLTGRIRAPDSDIYGEKITGRILIFRGGRGSTVGAMVIYSLKKNNKAPLAIITLETDPVIVSGVIFSNIPAVSEINEEVFDQIKTNDLVKIYISGKRAVIELG